VTQSEVIRAYNTNLPKPGGMWNINRNGDDLCQHRFDIDLVSFLLSLRFPEVPMSHIVTTCLPWARKGCFQNIGLSLRQHYLVAVYVFIFLCYSPLLCRCTL
jgi:hypothetical protein